MKTRMLFSSLLLLATLFVSGCGDKVEQAATTIELQSESKQVTQDAQNFVVSLSTNAKAWSVEVDNQSIGWCTAASLGSDKINITVTENIAMESRTATVTIKANDQSKSMTVTQLGADPTLTLSTALVNLGAIGGAITFDVTSNVTFEVSVPEWIVETRTRADLATTTYNFKAGINSANERRTGEIWFKVAGNDNISRKLIVNQKGMGTYETVDVKESFKDDIQVRVSSGTATSYQPGSGIELSFDGNMNTIYHSNWSNGGSNYFPITLTYNFERASVIDYLVYYPRQEGYNGFFKEVEIWASTEDKPTMTKLKDWDFGASSAAARVEVGLTKPTAIRFVIKSGGGDGNGFASCAEMEFYQTNPESFDYGTLFTDSSCSELKAGTTVDDIMAVDNTFFRNLAFFIIEGKYPTEFRIADYKAYPKPEYDANYNRTAHALSVRDNPTGISVASGDDLVVLVGPTNGRSVALVVQNLDCDTDGFGGTSYPLVEGINKLTIKQKGLCYVMYQTDTPEQAAAAQPIRIHFASGSVNGYFDVAKHTRDDWSRLLNAAVDKHFDVVGKYSHLTFPTASFKEYTSNGYDLINLYDKLVYSEQSLMGLYKYDRPMHNRAYLNVIYNSYMYATTYHTAYVVTSMDVLCDVDRLQKGDNSWGPAHEIGHNHQTAGMTWTGTTEVTNNIMSQYVERQLSGASRLQEENQDPYNNRYEKAFSTTFPDEIPHAKIEDVFCKLVPFWQMYLYNTLVLGNEDFYPDQYEMWRSEGKGDNPGENQLLFCYYCSKAAKLDLTDFFIRWGYLRPIDELIGDYLDAQVTVTQTQIDNMINRIKALGYPKPKHIVEYVTEDKVDIYKNSGSVVSGSATRSGQTITMTGWQNVVAYEVYMGGKLVYVGSESKFTVTGTTLTSAVEVYAISSTGSRYKVSF